MSTKTIGTKAIFFAAANGYNGFRSYFDELFNSAEYERIFVLKGGPGTGKSSLMRRVEHGLGERGYKTEAILCSSDPDSLDGVIAERDGGRVAILDGTAPHERDAVIAGAIDTLVPLGELWDERFIKAQKNKIKELTLEKSAAYKTAYSYLKIAGSAHATIKSADGAADPRKMNAAVDHIISKLGDINRAGSGTRLVSAFGKRGYTTLDTVDKLSDTKIVIGGSATHSHALMNAVLARIDSLGFGRIRLPSPLSDAETEGLLFCEQRISIVAASTADCAVNADDIFENSATDKERARAAVQLHRYALDEAVRWFGIASDMHTRLEEIYTSAMRFEEMDKIYESVMSGL